jgi:hypothetical protein
MVISDEEQKEGPYGALRAMPGLPGAQKSRSLSGLAAIV